MVFDPFVQASQRKLLAKGYDVGPADGYAGPATHAAIRAFQRDRKLVVTGTLTEETWHALDGAGERRDEIKDLRKEPVLWPRQNGVNVTFGAPGGPDATAGKVQLPYTMRIAWALGTTIDRFSCHRLVAASAQRVFERTARHYSQAEIKALGLDIFGGCFNDRAMRGSTKRSMHAWGIAIDIDPIRNQLKWRADRARLGQPDARPWWEFWEAEGWVSLGRARDFDWMHVQAARL